MPKECKSHIYLQDVVFGEMKISARTVDDAIMIKSDGFPTYHFANVVDDHEMRITMVLRGQVANLKQSAKIYIGMATFNSTSSSFIWGL